MYDKSKKTWSQRLKIQKNENSQTTAEANKNSAIAIAATNNSQLASTAAAARVHYNLEAHNANISRNALHQYQLAPSSIMHLPTLSDYHPSGAGPSYEYVPNHVNRSIKYAEPWIYGTVRGIPARPAGIYHPAYAHYPGPPHAATIFAAPSTDLATAATTATALAVVLCSCHEYLSGTKGRTLKKPSICKKCKGTRLPLHNIGGTVRLPANLPSPKLRPVGAASTVRVVSSNKKLRPTILDPQKDPYDLMRRTRLLSPEPGSLGSGSSLLSGGGVSSKEKLRQRGKSTSPLRGRSRTRHHKVLATNINSKENSKVPENFDETWLTESEDLAHSALSSAASSSSSSSSRRSILRCNVNPYDLISTSNHTSGHSSPNLMDSKEKAKPANRKQKLKFSENEFMPPNDDFNVQDAALQEEEPPFLHKTTKLRAESGKSESNRKVMEEPPPASTPPQNKKPNYANIQAIAGQRISLGEEQVATKSLLQQTADGTTTYENFAMQNQNHSSPKEMEKSNKTRPDTLQVSPVEAKRPPRVAKPQTSTNNDHKEANKSKESTEEEEEELAVTVTVTPTYNIKSILKRPSSKTSENSEATQTDHSAPATPSKQHESSNCSKNSSPNSPRHNQVTINAPLATSHFYISLPQARKKVQFLVDDSYEDLDDDDDDSSYDNSSTSSISFTEELKANYEYYNKKRNQKKLTNSNEQPEIISEDSETEVITYDEKFIQAMLLEKLQLDSELVTQNHTNNTNNNDNDNNQAQNYNEATALATNNSKTVDVAVVSANGEENKSQYNKQQEENQYELESHREKYDKHYNSENVGKVKTSLPPSSVTANEQTFDNATARTSLNPLSSTNSVYSNDIATLKLATHNDTTKCFSSKNDDTDDCSKCLSCINNNDEAEDENIIIVTGFKNSDDDGSNNVSTKRDSVDEGPQKKDDTYYNDEVDDDDDDDDMADQHLPDVFLFVDVKDGVDDGIGIQYAGKPPTCHRNDNNHSQDDNNVLCDDNVNISTPLSSVSKVQHNGAKKSTTSDYDDEAKTKQQHEQQQEQQQQKCIKKTKKDIEALAAVADSSSCNVSFTSNSITSSGNGSKNAKTPTKETQSRNPIRRSQSERQPTTTSALSTYRNGNISFHSNNNNNYNNNNGNNKKKTKDQQLNHDTAHVANGGSGNGGVVVGVGVSVAANNENIIPNNRNCSKNEENIPNNKNDSKSADCTGFKTDIKRNIAVKGSGSKTSLHFQDTMALRTRYNRSDSRDLFSISLLERPKEPPPPPPPSAAASSSSSSSITPSASATLNSNKANATTQLGYSLPKAVDLNESAKSATTTLASNAIEISQQQPQQKQQQTVNGLVSKQHQQQQPEQEQQQYLEQKLTIGHELKPANNTKIFQEINEATLSAEKTQQQQLAGNRKKSAELTNSEKITKDSYLPASSSSPLSSSKLLPTTSHSNQQQQKTIVRVAPFNKNCSEVHRLKICHTDNNELLYAPHSPCSTHTLKTSQSPSSPFSNSSHYSVTDLSTLNVSHEYGQKKTSILINGDDCYNTMNLSCDDASTPLYQSSVVVTDGSSTITNDVQCLKVTNTYNTVTINVSSPRSSEDELILQHNQLNNILKRQAKSNPAAGSIRAIIPIRGTIDINLQRSASSTSSTSTCSITSSSSSASSSSSNAHSSKRGKTLIRLDYEKEKLSTNELTMISSTKLNEQIAEEKSPEEWLPHEAELLKILRNPVEAVKRNLVPHICKLRETDTQKDAKRSKKMNERHSDILETSMLPSPNKPTESSSTFIAKLLEDPMLQQVAEGLETDTVAELIENSLKRLQESRTSLDMTGTKDNENMNRLIDISLRRIQEERMMSANKEINSNPNLLSVPTKDEERLSNRGSISSANSFASAHNYELFDFDANESDCYQSCSSDINSIMDEETATPETKTKFYQMLVDATLQEIELSTNMEDLTQDEHQYESIRQNIDPIYEEINDVPPPLPLTAPPLNDPDLEKKSARSIFEGASKYDILSYLVDAKERGLVKEESFDYPLNFPNPIIIEEESADTLSDLGKLNKLKRIDTISSRSSIMSDSSDDNQSTMSSLSPPSSNNFIMLRNKQATSDIERNDSGVGSETSKSSRSKFLSPTASNASLATATSSNSSHQTPPRSSPLHLCEDCDGPVETQIGDNGHIFAPLVCRKCGKKRVERKEIITEVVETEEKYGRDLQIILEEFCHPMLVAGLLTQEQLSAIFLNTEELLENNQTLAERMRDALDIALEQGDDDLLTVNIGKIFLESTQMLHAFESYCVRQAGASLLLANLEKEKELLRIFLKVSQMENAVLRRMNLNSFLMVPVQRVTKYPLLLARLYKVTPAHLEGRDQLKQAQEKIELHLNHINQEAKDVPTKLWRRISSSSPNRRASCEIDMINIKLRKMAIDVLEWNHDEVRFVMEGKLLYTQPTDSNWKKARTIKLTTVNALLVTNGKPSTNYKAEKVMSDKLNFPKHTGIREASLLVVKEKCGRYALIREPLYLDRCVVCSEADWDEYFEIQEISSKDTFIFKAEDNVRTKQWYTQLQYHAQGMGAWRKRRNALANIMINGMLTRS